MSDNPWNRYSVPAEVFITARSPEEARELLTKLTDHDEVDGYGAIVVDKQHGGFVYLGGVGALTTPQDVAVRLESEDAILPGGY